MWTSPDTPLAACFAAVLLRSCTEKAKELEEKQQKKKRKAKQQQAKEGAQQAGRGRKKGAHAARRFIMHPEFPRVLRVSHSARLLVQD